MDCDKDQQTDLYKIDGAKVGQIKMNFESDGEGVAVKFRKRNDNLIMKAGERDHSRAEVFDIPDDEELIGFHGWQDSNYKILRLGIITRKTICEGSAQ